MRSTLTLSGLLSMLSSLAKFFASRTSLQSALGVELRVVVHVCFDVRESVLQQLEPELVAARMAACRARRCADCTRLRLPVARRVAVWALQRVRVQTLLARLELVEALQQSS